METFFTPKNAGYCCVLCDFTCTKSSDWKRHLETLKHTDRHNGNDVSILETKKHTEKKVYICFCGNKYAGKSGLWKHKKKRMNQCDPDFVEKEQPKQDCALTLQLCNDLLKQNNELHQSLLSIVKDRDLIPTNTNVQTITTMTTTTNNNQNNHHKTFNLQIYLNETCKDAINMSDFVNQIQLTISDLEETGKLGYSEGISRVFLKNLNGISITSRPIHCGDAKRETIYVKNNDKWHKEADGKQILTNAIKQVAHKNMQQIREWQKLHPEYNDPQSKQNDKYMQIVLNSMSGSTKEESDKNYEKIMKNVIKETSINKCIL